MRKKTQTLFDNIFVVDFFKFLSIHTCIEVPLRSTKLTRATTNYLLFPPVSMLKFGIVVVFKKWKQIYIAKLWVVLFKNDYSLKTKKFFFNEKKTIYKFFISVYGVELKTMWKYSPDFIFRVRKVLSVFLGFCKY